VKCFFRKKGFRNLVIAEAIVGGGVTISSNQVDLNKPINKIR
jgi:hypothetical protein